MLGKPASSFNIVFESMYAIQGEKTSAISHYIKHYADMAPRISALKCLKRLKIVMPVPERYTGSPDLAHMVCTTPHAAEMGVISSISHSLLNYTVSLVRLREYVIRLDTMMKQSGIV